MLRNDTGREAWLRICAIRGCEEAVTALIAEDEGKSLSLPKS